MWPERLELVPLLEASFQIADDILEIGTGPFGRRRVLRAREGKCRFVGGRLSGREGSVLDESSDYALYSPDGESVLIDVRGVIEFKVDGGAKVYLYVNYQDEVELSKVDRDALGRPDGEVSFAKSKFIVQPRFEVGLPQGEVSQIAKDFQRLRRTRIVAIGQLKPQRIEYRMYEVVNPTAV